MNRAVIRPWLTVDLPQRPDIFISATGGDMDNEWTTLDVLEASLEEPVTVHLKDGTTYYGILAGYDQHMNIVIEPETDVDDRVDDDLDASSPSQSKTQRLYAAITSSPSKHDRLRNALSREKEQDGSREVPPLRRNPTTSRRSAAPRAASATRPPAAATPGSRSPATTD